MENALTVRLPAGPGCGVELPERAGRQRMPVAY